MTGLLIRRTVAAEVKVHAESLRRCVYTDGYSVSAINEAVCELKSGKAAGVSDVSNKFFMYGNSMALINVLHSMFNFIETGLIPTGFKTSLLIPIPKFKDIAKPALTISPSQFRAQSAPYLNFF